MKKKITNCLATTAMALIVLDIVAIMNHAHFLCVDVVFQVFFASILIHMANGLLQKIESPYFILDVTLNIGSTILILICSGYFFSWYDSVSVLTLVIMGIVVYVCGILAEVINIQKDIDYINHKLSDYKEKK